MANIDKLADIIPQLVDDHDKQQNVASLFSSSATYAVGDYVIHEANLYKCNTAISTAGAWDSTKWTLINIAEELKGIQTIDGAEWILTDNKLQFTLKDGDTIVVTSDEVALPTLQSLLGNVAIGTAATGVYYNGTAFVAATPEHKTSKNVISSTATGTSNTATTNSNTYLNHTEDNVVSGSNKIVGEGTVTVSADTSGVLHIKGEGGGGGMEADPYKLEVKSDGIHLEKNDVDFALGADDSFTVSKIMTKKPGATGSHYSIFEDTDGSLVFTVE